ncbi:MAG: PP2C family protein-serine/threonine phosphatase [bacterium]
MPFIQQQIALREREGHVRFEYYLLGKKNVKVPAIISSRTFHGPDQRQFVIVTCADIREQKLSEARLREAKDAAVAANHAKSELLAELKTRHDELEATLQQLKITQKKLEAENARKARETEKVILKAVPLGSFPDFEYQQKILKLRSGDTVLFVSDGLQETFNTQAEMLGEGRVIKLFTEIAHKRPEKIVAHLSRAAKSWANGRTQHDDMTILAMKMR